MSGETREQAKARRRGWAEYLLSDWWDDAELASMDDDERRRWIEIKKYLDAIVGTLAAPFAPARPFPLLLSYEERLKLLPLGCPRTVPWSFLAPHEQQAKDNHDQTLERLAERCGLGVAEMVCIVDGKGLRDVVAYSKEEEALPRLLELLAAYISSC